MGQDAGSGGGGGDASATAAAYLPEDRSVPSLRDAAADCRGCDLWRSGSQTVFGAGLRQVLEGSADGGGRARLMLVGEQPGDREDRDGRPFVGPAGAELDRALEEVGIDREQAYVTNVVKHFKFKPRDGGPGAVRPLLPGDPAARGADGVGRGTPGTRAARP